MDVHLDTPMAAPITIYSISFIVTSIAGLACLISTVTLNGHMKHWMLWLASTFFLIGLTAIGNITQVIVMIIQFPSESSRFVQMRASLYITVAAAFVEELARVLLIIVLAGTASWIVMAQHNQGKFTANGIKVTSYIVCSVLFIPRIVSLAMQYQCFSDLYSDKNLRKGSYMRDCENMQHTNRMRMAYMVLSFCTGIAMTVFSVILIIQNNRQPQISKTVPRYLLVCVVLFLLQTTHDLIIYLYMNLSSSFVPYSYAAIVLFSWLPPIIILFIMFALGRKIRKGRIVLNNPATVEETKEISDQGSPWSRDATLRRATQSPPGGPTELQTPIDVATEVEATQNQRQDPEMGRVHVAELEAGGPFELSQPTPKPEFRDIPFDAKEK